VSQQYHSVDRLAIADSRNSLRADGVTDEADHVHGRSQRRAQRRDTEEGVARADTIYDLLFGREPSYSGWA